MKPNDIRAWRERLDLSQAAAALLVGVDQRSWQRWELGERAMSQPLVRLLMLIDRFPQAHRFLEQLR